MTPAAERRDSTCWARTRLRCAEKDCGALPPSTQVCAENFRIWRANGPKLLAKLLISGISALVCRVAWELHIGTHNTHFMRPLRTLYPPPRGGGGVRDDLTF